MAVEKLPENVDSTYTDDSNDPSVQLHQHYHDVIHRTVNHFDLETRPPAVGEGLVWDGQNFVPGKLIAISGALPSAASYVVYDPTRGFIFSSTGPSTGGGTTDPGNGGGTTNPGDGGGTTPTKPTAPTGVSATALSSSRVQVSWTKSVSTTVTGYNVYLNDKLVATVGASVTSIVYENAVPQTSYGPKVEAIAGTLTSDKAVGNAVTTPAGAAAYDANGFASEGPTLTKLTWAGSETIYATAPIRYDPSRTAQQSLEMYGIDVREVDPATNAVISGDNNSLDFKPAASAQSTSTWGVEKRMEISGSTKLTGGTDSAPKKYRAQVFYKLVGSGQYPRVGPFVYFTVGATASGGGDTVGGTIPGGGNNGSADGAGPRKVIPAPPTKRGWWSGGSGVGIDGNSKDFGNWRGDPVDAIAHWADAYNGQLWSSWPGLKPGGPAYNFKGLLDLAIGGPENWSSTAYDAPLRSALQSLRTIRSGLGPTLIRPAHEFNGTWFKWSISNAEMAAARATLKRWRQIQLDVFPEAMWELNPNGDSSGQNLDWREMFEDKMPDGKTPVWDVTGADRYNQFPTVTSYAAFATMSKQVDGRGAPVGWEAHRLFALSKGVPHVLPEYAGNADNGDYPGWMTAMYEWMKKNRGNGPGNLMADFWFNQTKDNVRWQIYPNTKMPKLAAEYKRLFTAG